MYRFTNVFGTGVFERQRDASWIEVCLESRCAFERANIKFVGLLRHLGLSANDLREGGAIHSGWGCNNCAI
jgi:hypothetical protein